MGMDREEDGGDSLKDLNTTLKAMVVGVGMHKGKNVRNHTGRDKKGHDMDLHLVVGMEEEGMHGDCGLDTKMVNQNYPLTNIKF